MNRKTIRILMLFAVLFMAGEQTWAEVPFSEADLTVSVTSGGVVNSAKAVQMQCGGTITVSVNVTPYSGYYAIYNMISIYKGNTPINYSFLQDQGPSKISGGIPGTFNYKLPDEITSIPDDLRVTVSFIEIPKLDLKSNLGDKATVKFYDGRTTKPNASTFNPSSYTNSITQIDNSGGARYVIAHIEPKNDRWTYATTEETGVALLNASEKKSTGYSVSRGLTLLKRDTYTDSDNNTSVRYDGAGWYYYQIPAGHTRSADYTASVIGGDVPEKFNLSESDRVSQNVNEDGTAVVTVTDGTENGWKAEITLDEVSFPFDGSEKSPSITGITIKNGSETKFNLTDDADIAQHLCINNSEFEITRHEMSLTAEYWTNSGFVTLMGWFKKTCSDKDCAWFDITVPLPTDPAKTDSKGSVNNPWLIPSAEIMNLFAKCVNIGRYSFDGEYLQQTANITYDETTSAEFLPVGVAFTPFCGTFKGGDKTISNLDFSITDEEWEELEFDSSEPPSFGLFANVGGFIERGVVSAGSVNNVNLNNCKFTVDIAMQAFVGGIAGRVGYGSTISNCSVSSSTISSKGSCCEVGGIVGRMYNPSSAFEANTRNISSARSRSDESYFIEGCLVDGCTISNVMPEEESNGDTALDDDTESDGKNKTGGIIGNAIGGSLGNNRVMGQTTITSDVATTTDCPVGAIFGKASKATLDDDDPTLSDNLYAKTVKVIRKKGTSDETTVDGYTKRGYWTGSEFDDINDDTKGAMMEVYPVTLSCLAPDGYTASLEIDPEPVAGTNCYKIVAATEKEPAEYYFAPGDEINLAVSDNPLTRSDDIRTFYADLSLTMSYEMNDEIKVDNLMATDGKASFTMPSEDAAVKATYTEAGGFTITTNQKKWMSFFHNWGDNYTVSDPTSTNSSRTRAATNPVSSFEVLTIAKDGIDLNAGTATTLDLEGVSYSRVPTLFHSESNLPRLLRFEPTNVTGTPQYDNQFMGGVSDLSGYASQTVYLLFDSELVRADLSGGTEFNEHKAFVAIGGNANTRSLVFVDGETTAISLTPALSEIEGVWHNLQGLRLDGKPTKKGLYIMNGKKVVIK